jgi:citrate/tricarballylate utilization protein
MSKARSIPVALVEEGQRMASICNACRYCEGFCAVFPALERRLSFGEGDLAYLANLCHDCGSCYYACQYAPPHEFQVNFPKMLADLRMETYRKYAWPGPLAAAFESNGTIVGVIGAASLAVFLCIMFLFIDPGVLLGAHADSAGAFYAVLSHRTMAWTFGVVFLVVVAALVAGFVRFWRDTGESVGALFSPRPLSRSVNDVLQLRYLAGGGDGCTYPDEMPSHARRWFHHLTFYGFMLCFAATCVATIYHYVFGWKAPYAFWSLPVLLGTAGGIGLLIGPAGLLWLKSKRDPVPAGAKQTGMDVGFLALLWLSGASGLLLLGLRESSAMGVLLGIHLAIVMALFVTLPYGKFVHAIYRLAALLRFHLERQRSVPEVGAE